ncbi:MAG: hypothetical protein COX29_00020 [Candidatus Moranbacteria bacterium CG23_combo_of_CG06-09_8_20_14_all_35_22]|nr:MAG: hypothetical protein COX29_00020 [Candidatus Moranbacteria bacterium CG23_combo_of_CG06-09_8_20_14_all_35_22]
MDKKTYWWRALIVLTSVSLLGVAYVMNGKSFLCLEIISGPLFIMGLTILIISIFLFFINDKIFLKWLRFAGVWIILSIFAIAITPSHSGGILSFGGPSKEDVSIWMGALFVILSLAKIIWDSKKQN